MILVDIIVVQLFAYHSLKAMVVSAGFVTVYLKTPSQIPLF